MFSLFIFLPICFNSYINSHECDYSTAKLAASECSKLILVCINMCLHIHILVNAQSNILLFTLKPLLWPCCTHLPVVIKVLRTFLWSYVVSSLFLAEIIFSEFCDFLFVECCSTLAQHQICSATEKSDGVANADPFEDRYSSQYDNQREANAFSAECAASAALPAGMHCKLLVDTGASIHITGRIENLKNVQSCKLRVQSFQGTHAYATHYGSLTMHVRRHNRDGMLLITLNRVYYVEGCPRDLCSWSCLSQHGATLHLERKNCYGSVIMSSGAVEKFEVHHDQMFEIHGYLPPKSYDIYDGQVFAAQHLGKIDVDASIRAELSSGGNQGNESVGDARIRNDIELARLLSNPNLENMRWSRKIPTSPHGTTYKQAHETFGHPSRAIMQLLPAVYGFTPHSDYYSSTNFHCDVCALANARRGQFLPTPIQKPGSAVGDLITTDVVGPFSPGIRGESHLAVFVECRSRFIVAYPIKTAGGIKESYHDFMRDYMKNIKVLRAHMDNDAAKSLRDSLLKDDIMLTTSVAYESRQNGLAERAILSLEVVARSLQATGGAPSCFFVNAMKQASVILRFVPRRSLGFRSPYHVVNKCEPVFPLNIKPLYCAVIVHNPNAKKNENQGQLGILIGFAHIEGLDSLCKAYEVMLIDDSGLQIHRVSAANCKFNTGRFPFKDIAKVSAYIGDRTLSRQPGHNAVGGTVIYLREPLYSVLLDDGQMVHVVESELKLWIKAATTERHKNPTDVPTFKDLEFVHPDDAQLNAPPEIEGDDGAEHGEGEEDLPPPDDPPHPPVVEPFVPIDNNYNGMTQAQYDLVPPGYNFQGDMTLVNNQTMPAVGSVVQFPSFFWGNDFEWHTRSYGLVKKGPYRRRFRGGSNDRTTDAIDVQLLYHGDANNFAPSLETYVQSVEVVQKFCTFITQHELEITNPSPGGAAAHGAFQYSTPPFTTCGEAASFYSQRPPDEVVNADYMVETSDENVWALQSGLDDTEYSKSAEHEQCNHYFCSSSFTSEQYAGLGYTQVLRRKSAEAWAVQDFLQSLNTESTEHILSQSRSKQDSIPDPINDREAESHPYKAEWRVACTAEVKALNDKNVLREATSAELTKSGLVALQC